MIFFGKMIFIEATLVSSLFHSHRTNKFSKQNQFYFLCIRLIIIIGFFLLLILSSVNQCRCVSPLLSHSKFCEQLIVYCIFEEFAAQVECVVIISVINSIFTFRFVSFLFAVVASHFSFIDVLGVYLRFGFFFCNLSQKFVTAFRMFDLKIWMCHSRNQ